jgi:hypothetical protein|tara:strand:+ start:437 stop:823 length:387 start_codon:yes stop_codon:yes gene_type:complete
MAKFAEINSLNEVLKIIDINDQDIIDNGGHQSTEVAQFIETIIPLSDSGVKWVEMTDDGSFRKQGAVVGGTYDSIKDKFINPKPYPSWILNVNDDWESPIGDIPSTTTDGSRDHYNWNESNQSWDKIN